MNAKLAKKLRRAARARTVGLPEKRLIAARVNAPCRQSGEAIVARNDVRTTRGLYRAFKQAANDGRLG